MCVVTEKWHPTKNQSGLFFAGSSHVVVLTTSTFGQKLLNPDWMVTQHTKKKSKRTRPVVSHYFCVAVAVVDDVVWLSNGNCGLDENIWGFGFKSILFITKIIIAFFLRGNVNTARFKVFFVHFASHSHQ